MSSTQKEIDQIIEVCENIPNSPEVSPKSSEEQSELQNDSDHYNKIFSVRDGIHKIDYLQCKLLMDQGLLKVNLII